MISGRAGSQSGVGVQPGAGCDVGASQHGLSLRIMQGKVGGRVTATVSEHRGCRYHSCCKWEREALEELCLPRITP